MGAVLVAATLVAGLLPVPLLGSAPAAAAPAPVTRTNLAHLDFLCDQTVPPPQPAHDTYRLAEQPAVGTLWTYAEPDPDGAYRRLGGGRYDQATGHWSQGAYNADDLARAAVVYLRHWQATGQATSRQHAYQLLRGLTYLQTASGPDAGNVVLWMQPDGTLNPVADPPDTPAPSDSADSYWLARTVWALGEGYAAFRTADQGFAAFLRERITLALGALERGPLSWYQQWLDIDGTPVPAWLIADGADATGEALLGLAAYVTASGDRRAAAAMHRLAEGVAAMRAGDQRRWPFGAVLPWASSRSVWHAWGGLALAGLAAAASVSTRQSRPDPAAGRAWLDAAVAHTASFLPHLIVAGGPDNGWLPTPGDRSQIAYGAQSMVESLLRVGAATGRGGLTDLAGVAAAWFFGANPAGELMYDPATGRTFDGVRADGAVNRNSGAESTIHGLLAMLALDAHPAAARLAAAGPVRERHTATLVEAESGTLTGDAAVLRPAEAWTGEALWSGGAGVRLGVGAGLRLPVAARGRSVLLPVVFLAPGAGRARWSAGGRRLGTVDHGAVGSQGDSPAPGLLTVDTLPGGLPAGRRTVEITAVAAAAVLDALLVQPELEWVTAGGSAGAGWTLVRSFAGALATAGVPAPTPGRVLVRTFTADGRAVSARATTARPVPVTLPPGGFAWIEPCPAVGQCPGRAS